MEHVEVSLQKSCRFLHHQNFQKYHSAELESKGTISQTCVQIPDFQVSYQITTECQSWAFFQNQNIS